MHGASTAEVLLDANPAQVVPVTDILQLDGLSLMANQVVIYPVAVLVGLAMFLVVVGAAHRSTSRPAARPRTALPLGLLAWALCTEAVLVFADVEYAGAASRISESVAAEYDVSAVKLSRAVNAPVKLQRGELVPATVVTRGGENLNVLLTYDAEDGMSLQRYEGGRLLLPQASWMDPGDLKRPAPTGG